MTISRRQFAVLISAAAVAGCSGTPTQTPIWVAGLEAVATEFGLVLPQLQTAGLTGPQAETAQQIIAQIQAALKAISAASTQSQGQAVLVQVEGYINALAPLALPFLPLVPGGPIIALIIAALPAIEFALNFGVSLLSPTALQVATAAAPMLPANVAAGTSITASQQALQELIRRAHGGK